MYMVAYIHFFTNFAIKNPIESVKGLSERPRYLQKLLGQNRWTFSMFPNPGYPTNGSYIMQITILLNTSKIIIMNVCNLLHNFKFHIFFKKP